MSTPRRKSKNTTTPARLGRLGDFVGFRLRRLQNQLSRNFGALIADQNARSGLFSSLAIIEANPGISQRELSAEVGLDKSLTVVIVDELESRGFAARRRDEEDRRRHALHITPAGTRWLDKMFSALGKTESAALQRLSPRELQQLHRLLDRMYLAFSQDDSPAH